MKRGADGDTEVDSTVNIKISDVNGESKTDCPRLRNLNCLLLNLRLFSDGNFQLKLKRSQNLIDKSFVFISRNQNYSEFLDDSFNVAQMYGDCLYRSENSAFDLCNHEIVSSFLHAMSGVPLNRNFLVFYSVEFIE